MNIVKKACALLLLTALLCSCFCACSGPADVLYGTWYMEADEIRNVFQFYDNDGEGDSFIWAVYDIAADETKSVDTGGYQLYGEKLTLEYASGTKTEFTWEREGNYLFLTKDGTTITLQLYTLEGQQ